MDIGTDTKLAKNHPYVFTFDGIDAVSLQSLLQAFKFKTPEVQEQVCRHVGKYAKQRAQKRNKVWKKEQTLWWNRVPYDRHSNEYQNLICRVFIALAKNDDFCKALLATGDDKLICSHGKSEANKSVLTREEFCAHLTSLRDTLQAKFEQALAA